MTAKVSALIVVDVQNDFCPGGALPVKAGDRVIPNLNVLIASFAKLRLPIILTRDWHPRNHCSFKEQGGIWPPHCVRETKGADFHPDLLVPTSAIIINKGTDAKKEAYSAFQGTRLAKMLTRVRVRTVSVGGLATDYCVKNTVADGLEAGFEVDILTDCVKGVNLKRTDSTEALAWMEERGAKLLTSRRLLRKLGRRVAVISSS